MFGRSKTQKLKENAVSASELALQLAKDRKFRKRLLSAIEHSSEAGRRTRRGLGLTGTITRLASDQALKSELRKARNDLQRAYGQLEATRRRHKLRRFTLLAGLTSLAAVPQLRERITTVIANAPKHRQRLTDIANRMRPADPSDGPSRPSTLEELTREELYARAQEADIRGRSEMSKQQLVDALRAKG
jgi:Rho termination factor, N-terminal domain